MATPDALRAVWADALTERGDPRGEFVTLQLATARGESTPAQQRRAHALFLEHWKKWVGSLAPSLCTYRFVSRPKLMKVVDDPAWSTVRELRLRDGEPSRSDAEGSAVRPFVPCERGARKPLPHATVPVRGVDSSPMAQGLEVG